MERRRTSDWFQTGKAGAWLSAPALLQQLQQQPQQQQQQQQQLQQQQQQQQ